jgi:hypothetical protein
VDVPGPPENLPQYSYVDASLAEPLEAGAVEVHACLVMWRWMHVLTGRCAWPPAVGIQRVWGGGVMNSPGLGLSES